MSTPEPQRWTSQPIYDRANASGTVSDLPGVVLGLLAQDPTDRHEFYAAPFEFRHAEQQLFAAMIRDCGETIRNVCDAVDKVPAGELKKALDDWGWIFSKSTTPNSFIGCCEACNIDPAWLRNQYTKLYSNAMGKVYLRWHAIDAESHPPDKLAAIEALLRDPANHSAIYIRDQLRVGNEAIRRVGIRIFGSFEAYRDRQKRQTTARRYREPRPRKLPYQGKRKPPEYYLAQRNKIIEQLKASDDTTFVDVAKLLGHSTHFVRTSAIEYFGAAWVRDRGIRLRGILGGDRLRKYVREHKGRTNG